MQREDLYKKDIWDFLNKRSIEKQGEDYYEDGEIVEWLWSAYQEGYQDRIDDYDGEEDTTEQDEWERTR